MLASREQMACSRARVVEKQGSWARVEVTRDTLCDHCTEKESCGALLDGSRQTLALVKNPLDAGPGDLVELSISEGVVLWGALTLYAIPLAGLLLFVVLALYLNRRLDFPVGEDTLAILAGAAGLALAIPVVRLISTRWKYLAEGTPVIFRILPPDGGR